MSTGNLPINARDRIFCSLNSFVRCPDMFDMATKPIDVDSNFLLYPDCSYFSFAQNKIV